MNVFEYPLEFRLKRAHLCSWQQQTGREGVGGWVGGGGGYFVQVRFPAHAHP